MLYVGNFGSFNGPSDMPFKKYVETRNRTSTIFEITISKIYIGLHAPLKFTLPYC